ncbi:MAG: hypothetical protein A4E53_00557 [Pelotomaculum sp. PtaB.Bin104]|nr:MAG: hypothetical protein A4E53_00557 [Pelotomaculum sp. PtaB.Bin104]
MVTVLEVLRKEKNLTGAELSRRMGYNQRALSPVERRTARAWPALRRKVAATLNVNESSLFDGEGFAIPLEVFKNQ